MIWSKTIPTRQKYLRRRTSRFHKSKMWFEYSHAHDFGKDLRVSRSNVISNPNWQYHSKLNLIQLCRKNVKMSFGDKVIEKANEERRRLEREILCFFTLSVVSLLLSLSDRPLQNIGPTPGHFMPTEPSTHLNIDTTTFVLEKYVTKFRRPGMGLLRIFCP